GGSNAFDLLAGRLDGSLLLNVDGGSSASSDSTIVTGTAGAGDAFTVVPGSTSNSATVFVQQSTASAGTQLNLTNMGQIVVNGGGGAGADGLQVDGTTANDT